MNISKIRNIKRCCYKLYMRRLYHQQNDSLCTPIKKYSDLLKNNVLKPDKTQFLAMVKLQELYNDLTNYQKNSIDKESDSNQDLLSEEEASLDHKALYQTPKGLYLHGGVGTGKTMLLDLFYDCVPINEKKRVHFNSFMLYLYSEINRWNLCSDVVDDTLMSPTEHIANKIMEDTWLLCFDEIQLVDYASSTLLEGVFSHMISKGAVIVSTSNRPPTDLGDASISDNFDGIITKSLSSFKSLFESHCVIHELESHRDHRTEMKSGELRFFNPILDVNVDKLDKLFADHVRKSKNKLTSTFVEVYGRKILIPVSCDNIARFSFKDLCCQPLGPADYLEICNNYEVVFVDDIPKMTIAQKNEARRFLSFIDAVYETRAKLYCTAHGSPQELFLMLPRNDGEYQVEQMHMEMIGEIAYDLKLHGMDFKSLNILSGEDEIFSFKRAISRLNEMQSLIYQNTKYRKQAFVPYIGTRQERDAAEENRKIRKRKYLEKYNEDQNNEISDKDLHHSFTLNKNSRTFQDTDWGDEASYITHSREAIARDVHSNNNNDPPKFGEMHFWGFGWWEHVKNKFKKK